MLFANTFGEKQNEFAHPYLYVSILCIIISVISQTHFLALGLKYFDALFIVPVFQCFFITLSILGGAIYWKETSGFNGTQWFVFVLGVIVVRDVFFSLSLFLFLNTHTHTHTQVLWGVFLMSSRDMEVDGASRRTSTNVTNDSYLPLDDGDVELSDDVRRRGITRRNTAGEFVSDAGETVLDAIRRPISILIEPELLNLREGYFDVKETPTKNEEEKDDVESKENESKKDQTFDDRIKNRLNQRRRRTERKVMGFLPVFLNPDLDESGTCRVLEYVGTSVLCHSYTHTHTHTHTAMKLTLETHTQVLHLVSVSDLKTLVIPFHFVIVYIDVRNIRLWSRPSQEVT